MRRVLRNERGRDGLPSCAIKVCAVICDGRGRDALPSRGAGMRRVVRNDRGREGLPGLMIDITVGAVSVRTGTAKGHLDDLYAGNSSPGLPCSAQHDRGHDQSRCIGECNDAAGGAQASTPVTDASDYIALHLCMCDVYTSRVGQQVRDI